MPLSFYIYNYFNIPVLFLQRAVTGAPYTDARLRVCVDDVNDYIPEFQGLDRVGRYPAAVSDQTEVGDVVLTVIAIDLDGVAPNNEVMPWSHEHQILSFQL